MPKKFTGENSKSAVARAHKESVRQEKLLQKQKEIEDAYWKDDDKHVIKKQQRKDDKDKKRQEQLEKKLTAKKLLEEEMSSIKSNKLDSTKMTREQIISQLDKSKVDVGSEARTVQEEPLEENLNRLDVDVEEASTIDEALVVFGDKTKEIDLHPEKRLKAAFAAFEAENLERLKKEYPALRLSQIKQLLRKEWMKSPANPLNNL